MKIVPYASDHQEEWDAFLHDCYNATFLHSRRFLSYHESRFEDASLRILDGRGRSIGLFPAAVNPSDPREVVSHPGLTYGGIVHGRRLQGRDLVECLQGIARGYRDRGFSSLRYKAIPHVYHVRPAEDDLYALWSLGARQTRCDLSAAVDLTRWDGPQRRLRRALRKATENGVVVAPASRRYREFWAVLSERLWTKHRVAPTHRLDEIEKLVAWFPENIRLAVSLLGSQLIAGLVLFETAQTVHVQYSVTTEIGARMGALELVAEACVREAARRQKRYFDFGISTEQDGVVFNRGLHEFKVKFGASGVAYGSYQLELGAWDQA